MENQFWLSNIVVFHRPSFCIELAQIVDRLKENGCRVIADYDDYVFDVSGYRGTSAGQKITKNSEDEMLLIGISRNYSSLELFDEFFVSTLPLKHNLDRTLLAAARKNYKIHVIPNSPSDYWFSYANILFNRFSFDSEFSNI